MAKPDNAAQLNFIIGELTLIRRGMEENPNSPNPVKLYTRLDRLITDVANLRDGKPYGTPRG
jgi:hypothetical protein